MDNKALNSKRPELYDPLFEHDNCGIGAIVNINGMKSHKTVSDALTIVERLEHRAGKDALGETGDGVGILTQIPHGFFKDSVKDFSLPGDELFGVGMFFFPAGERARKEAQKIFELVLEKENLKF